MDANASARMQARQRWMEKDAKFRSDSLKFWNRETSAQRGMDRAATGYSRGISDDYQRALYVQGQGRQAYQQGYIKYLKQKATVNEGGQGIRFQSPHIQSQFIHTTGPVDVETNHPNTMGYGAEGSHMEIVVTPIDGETLMWPSNLLHTVNEQEGEYERVAISFNLKHNDPIDDTHHGTELNYEFLQY